MMQQLILDEAIRLQYYHDTADKVTVGVGWNVTDRGIAALEKLLGRKVNWTGDITRAEALLLLANDIERFEPIVRASLSFYDTLAEVRQRVCLDMAFNMGFKALGFKNAIDAIRHQNWPEAARQLLGSYWALQVGQRAERLAHMLLTGVDCPAFAAVVV